MSGTGFESNDSKTKSFSCLSLLLTFKSPKHITKWWDSLCRVMDLNVKFSSQRDCTCWHNGKWKFVNFLALSLLSEKKKKKSKVRPTSKKWARKPLRSSWTHWKRHSRLPKRHKLIKNRPTWSKKPHLKARWLVFLQLTRQERAWQSQPRLTGDNPTPVETNKTCFENSWVFLFQKRSVSSISKSNCCRRKHKSCYTSFASLLDFCLWVKFICRRVCLLLLICFFYSMIALKLAGQLGRSLSRMTQPFCCSHYPGSSELLPWFHRSKISCWSYTETYHRCEPTLGPHMEKYDENSQE